MAHIGIMIEGQDGNNWPRWKRLVQAVEDFGYQCLFRSDHFTNMSGPDKDSLELWVALTYVASHTDRIEFGPLVAPITFRTPAMTARMAAAVDELSDGRLVLGLGAGWQQREHTKFGVPFYDFPTRFDMLEDGLEIVTQLFNSDEPVTYQGEHFSLEDATLLPRPLRPGGPPILIGGRGRKRTMPLAAKYADEWNGVFMPLEDYKDRIALLDSLLAEDGRKASDVKRSLMTNVIFGKDDAALKSKLESREIADPHGMMLGGYLIGTASELIEQIGQFVEAGVQRFMLQWLDQDDIEGLELMARDVLPHFHDY